MSEESSTTTVSAGFRCLVIGPIGSALAPIGSEEHKIYTEAIEVFGTVIEPACKTFGISPVRSDGMRKPGEIPDQLYRAIRDWELVIADLTDANPNVMYELALRHITGKCTIAISEYRRLPFDVGHIRTEQFVRTEAGLIAGRGRLLGAIEAFLQSGCDELNVYRVFHLEDHLPSPILPGSAAGVLEQEPSTPTQGSISPQQEGAEHEPPGFLDIIAESEAAIPRLVETLVAIATVIERLADLAAAGTHDVADLQAQGRDSASERLIIVARTASAFEGPAAQLEALVAAYEDDIGQFDRGNTFLLDHFEEDRSEAEEAADYLTALSTLAANSRTTFEQSESLAHTMEEIGRSARVLRGPTTRIAVSLRRLVELSAPIDTWAKRADAIRAAVPSLEPPGE